MDFLSVLKIIQGTLNGHSNAALFVFSTVPIVPIVWNDNNIFTRVRTFISKTLLIYREQQALNDQTVEVNLSIIELLRYFICSETND